MEQMLQRIQKISKIIQVAMNICIVIFGFIVLLGLVMTVIFGFIVLLGLVMTVVPLVPFITHPELLDFRAQIVASANLLPVDILDYIFGETHLKLQIALSGLFIAIMAGIFLYCILDLKKIFKKIGESRTPFTTETSKDFKKLSLMTLPICLFSTMLGIAIFLAVRLLAYVFEYGAYLQGKADETNRIQEEMIMSFLGEDRAKIIRLASTMHDIGKLMIPAEILEKPARLTDEEFAVIKKHPGYGGELLKNVEGDVMGLAKTVALEHHERPDGRGYPEGLQEEALSIEGQIVAVADVYDALTSKRSYKQAWDEKDAYNEILKGRGTQFNAQVVDAFEKVYPEINKVRQELQG